MQSAKLSEKKSVCYNYFHVPGGDEISLIRKSVVDSISRELGVISTPLNSLTVQWTDIQECIKFLESNPRLRILKSVMSRDYFIGEIALFAGWFLALSSFVQSEYQTCIIFEGDLWINCENYAALHQLQRILRNLPGDTDLLFIYSPEDNFERYKPEFDISEFFCDNFNTWSTAFTLITKVGAGKVLSLFERGVDLALDGFLLSQPELGKYSLKPVQQAQYFSTYDRSWIGSQIDPSMGLVPRIMVTESHLS